MDASLTELQKNEFNDFLLAYKAQWLRDILYFINGVETNGIDIETITVFELQQHLLKRLG